MSKKSLIIANWKMNPDSPGRALLLAKKIERRISVRRAEVVIAPPFPFLKDVGRALKKAKLGAQDMHWADLGPYTGEVSWHQLRHLRVQYVIIGHSERRWKLGETDAEINKKVHAALKTGLIPVLAVGERKKMSDAAMRATLEKQLALDLKGISQKQFGGGVIAYEPVWAIGTGDSATPMHAQKALEMITAILKKLWRTKTIKTRILYGGSVNAKNARDYITKNGGAMHGLLVGGSSLNPKEFLGIVKTTATQKT